MASLWHMVREAVASLTDGQPLRLRPHAKPRPVIEVAQVLADGTPIKAVWSYIQPIAAAKWVTVHFVG